MVMATVTVIWAVAAEAIITDGAGDAAITTAGHAVIIATTTDSQGGRFGGLRLSACREIRRRKDQWCPRCLGQ